MAGWKSIVPILGPVAALGIAALLWHDEPSANSDRQNASGGPSPENEAWVFVDFSALKPGGTVPGWDVGAGAFKLVEKDGRTVLELEDEPMVEGKLRSTQTVTGGGALRARMIGERSRRATPRFCVSFHGETEYQLRAVPSGDVLEITAREQVLASVPWQWNKDVWLWLELRMIPPGPEDQGLIFEGRAWSEGESRPATPTVLHRSTVAPGLFRAVVQGAPFALRPIYYDQIGTLRL